LEELLARAAVLGVDLDYAQEWWQNRNEKHEWVHKGYLIDWSPRLKRNWEKYGREWKARHDRLKTQNKPSQAEEELYSVEAELQWQKDGARIAELRKLRARLKGEPEA